PPVIAPYPYAWLSATFTYPDTGPRGRISATASIPVIRACSMFTDVTMADPGTVLSSMPGALRLWDAESLVPTRKARRGTYRTAWKASRRGCGGAAAGRPGAPAERAGQSCAS